MEVTCSRCHQVVPTDSCFCSTCGLPQLVYATEGDSAPQAPQPWTETASDASAIDWKTGMRAAVTLGVPAGLLSSEITPLSALGIFWMAGAAAWAVVRYMRGQRPAWITIGAGARIGLVTGLIAGWLAFGLSGVDLFVRRVTLHQGNQIDSTWREYASENEQLSEQLWKKMGASSQQIQESLVPQHNLMLSPEGHAGFQTAGLIWSCLLLVLFSVAGGALGARTMARRRPNA
ncbi:MAG TPA: zinc ribbon domain-containing protein [Terracidiphilus sp.]|jgi:hypothetical protein